MVHDWEIESMAHLLEDVYIMIYVLKKKRKKDFQLKSYYKTLREWGTTFPWQSIGKFVYRQVKGSFLLVLYGSRENFDNK